jgi:hypothetical protein
MKIVSGREVVLLWSMNPDVMFGMAVLDMPVFRFFYFSRVHIVGWVIVFKARHCHCDSVGTGEQRLKEVYIARDSTSTDLTAPVLCHNRSLPPHTDHRTTQNV